MDYLLDIENTANPEPIAQENFERIDARLVFAILTEATVARTLALTDLNKWIRTTHADPVAITVPPQADVNWPAAAEIVIEQAGAGTVEIIEGAGVTVNTSQTLYTAGLFAVVALKRVATDEWTLTGERLPSGS
jgi:hypothetical protein